LRYFTVKLGPAHIPRRAPCPPQDARHRAEWRVAATRYIYIYVCTYAYVCMHIYIHMCVCVCIYRYISLKTPYVHPRTRVIAQSGSSRPRDIYIYMCVHIHMYVCIFTYIYVCVCVYLSIYIPKRAPCPPQDARHRAEWRGVQRVFDADCHQVRAQVNKICGLTRG